MIAKPWIVFASVALIAAGTSGCASHRAQAPRASAVPETSVGIGCALLGGGAGAAAGQAVSSAAGGVIGGGAGAVLASLLCDRPSFARIDTDTDGRADDTDICPGTPAGVAVDGAGCPLDNDGDGVANYLDDCPGTPAGVRTDKRGCGGSHDSDVDGVSDALDQCPHTPAGASVDAAGCSEHGEALLVIEDINFDFDRSVIRADAARRLDRVVRTLTANPHLHVRLEGHADSVGTVDYNLALSEQRAHATARYLVERGIEATRLTSVGKGESAPLNANATPEMRARNRRVEFIVTQK